MAFADIFLIAVFVLASRNILTAEATPVNKDPEICQRPVCYESAQFLLDAMDTSVDPCDDFYRYACGGWIDKHPIPDGRKSYSVFAALGDEVDDALKESLKTVTNENYPKPVLDAANFFQGCIDEEARERQGLDPLKAVLNTLGGWPMIDPGWSDAGYQWHKQVAKMKRTLDTYAIIATWISLDDKDPSKYAISITEPSFGLRDAHLRNMTSSNRTKEIVAAYRSYIIATGKLLNPNIEETQLANDADEIIQFESRLAQPTNPPEEESDEGPSPWYQELLNAIQRKIVESEKGTITVSEAEEITENTYFKWADFLNLEFQDFVQVTDDTEITVYSRDYLKYAIKLANDTNPRVLANYIGWILLKDLGSYTTKDFRSIAFDFEKVEQEIKKPEKLEKTCLEQTTTYFSHAVSRLYVDSYVSEEEMNDVRQLGEDIRSAFEINLNHNEWMDPETKGKALEKLRAMKNCVGYPPWIRNDSDLSEYYSAVQDLNKDEFFESFVKVTQARPIIALQRNDRNENETTRWHMSPSEVNAIYNPSANSMTFPAAIFNPPIYKYGRSPALNYAGIGSFVTHEITHGFDDEGSKYDKEGKLVNWWSKETKELFNEKAECIRKQYSSFVEPMTNMSLNGRQTLGDDIADNGGLRNAFLAFKLQVLQAEENEVIRNTRLPGLSATQEQLFFIAYGTMECARLTKEYMKSIIERDAHSPPEYRILVPLSNSRAFSEAFNCPVGSRMNPEEKCQLW